MTEITTAVASIYPRSNIRRRDCGINVSLQRFRGSFQGNVIDRGAEEIFMALHFVRTPNTLRIKNTLSYRPSSKSK